MASCSQLRIPQARGFDASRRRFLLAGAVLVLAAASSLAVWVRGEVAVRDRATTARRALAEGQIDEAAAALDHWLSAARDCRGPLSEGGVAWRRGDLDTVNQELSRAQQLGHPPAELAGLRGLLLAKTGQTAEAEPALRQAFDGPSKLDPEVADALARLYLGAFRMGRATEVLERWRREVPDDARPYFLQTEIDLRSGVESDIVIDRFRTAIRYDPGLDRDGWGWRSSSACPPQHRGPCRVQGVPGAKARRSHGLPGCGVERAGSRR